MAFLKVCHGEVRCPTLGAKRLYEERIGNDTEEGRYPEIPAFMAMGLPVAIDHYPHVNGLAQFFVL